MVAKTLNRHFARLIVLPELNYREVQPGGVKEKIAILYHSTVDEADNSKGGRVHGWMEKEPAEIVAIDNAAIYDCPAIRELGISDADGLREYVAGMLQTQLENIQKDFTGEYKAELVAVVEEMIAELGSASEVVVGGIHRSLAMPHVVAKWRYDNKRPDKELHLKFTENVPCEVLSPTDWADLFAQAHEKNGRAMSQIGFTTVDLIKLALYVMVSLFENVTFFRSFVMTGNKRLTPADIAEMKKAGTIKDGGSKFSLPWAVAAIHKEFPELDILKRIMTPADTTDPLLKANRIDIKRLQYGPLGTTDIHRNINYFRACASKELSDLYRKGSQFKEPAAGSEPSVCHATGIYWTAEQRAAWWIGNCPDHPANAKGMPVQVATDTTVEVDRVKGVAKDAETGILRAVADNLLAKDGRPATIAEFQTQNRSALMVADGFFTLAKGDAATATILTKIVTGLQAVKDKSPDTFRPMCADIESVINEVVGNLKADNDVPPKAESKSPPKGSSKSPPTGSSKSAKKATGSKK